MKKLFLLSLLLIAVSKISWGQQCDTLPFTGTTYFLPAPDSFPCIVRGEPFSGTMYFADFVYGAFPDSTLPFSILSYTFDSIIGLPSGINYTVNPSTTFVQGESGCIHFYGTTSDSVGVDSLYMYLTVELSLLGPVTLELGSLADSSGNHFRYFVRVIEQTAQCPNAGVGSINLFTGSVFYDANNNGTFDSIDNRMANIPVDISPGQVTSFTRQDGSYYIFAASGNYTVSITPPTNYIVSGTTSYNIATSGSFQTYSGNDFGLYPTMLINDLSVSLTSGAARPGFITNHWIHYQNIGTSILNGTVAYSHSPVLSFVSATVAPTSQNASNLTWDFTNLYPGQQRSIHLHLQIPPNTTLLGDTLVSYVNLPTPRDTNLLNNKDTTGQIVTGSYDPNDKQVSPDDTKNGVRPEQLLTYTVRFQNTGTDTAFKIVIRDTLDNFLDASSFQTIAASHPYAFQLEGGKYAIWTFDNILLPDSGIDEPSSHGFVKYAVGIKQNTPDETAIENSASIYFDFNDPIHTNTVESRINLTSGIHTEELIQSNLFPNPASETFTLTLSRTLVDFGVQLLDASGRVIQSLEQLSGNRVLLDAKNLENGIYFYQIISRNKILSRGKLAVMR